jgi:hypothetical protein
MLCFLLQAGFLFNPACFAQFIGGHVPASVVVPVKFLIFALAGLDIAVLGYQLTKYKKHSKKGHIHSAVRL